MIKLERIYVQNYKNIAEADLPLGNMNVIVGENGSGKSNLLSVIPLLYYIISGPINEVKAAFDNGGDFSSYGRLWDNNKRNDLRGPLVMKVEFSDSDSKAEYMYEIQFESIQVQEKLVPGVHFQYSYSDPQLAEPPMMMSLSLRTKILCESLSYKLKSKTGKAITIFKRQGNEISYGDGIRKTDSISNIDEYTSVIRLLTLIKSSTNIAQAYRLALNILEYIFASNVYYLSPQSLKQNGIFFEVNRIVSFSIEEEIFFLLKADPMLREVVKAEYKNALKRILDIDDIDAEAFQDHKGGRIFYLIIRQNGKSKSLGELSDGTIVLLALITKIFSDSSDIFFIEEPENSIHPLALQELMKLIRERSLDKQFIITTHSPYLLNMINPEEVLVAERKDDGLSTISKLPNVKAIKKKLAKSFMNFGDIVFAETETDSDSE